MGPKFKFAKHGQCGAELSEMLPHLAEVVDDITIIKSMQTDQFNHAPDFRAGTFFLPVHPGFLIDEYVFNG